MGAPACRHPGKISLPCHSSRLGSGRSRGARGTWIERPLNGTQVRPLSKSRFMRTPTRKRESGVTVTAEIKTHLARSKPGVYKGDTESLVGIVHDESSGHEGWLSPVEIHSRGLARSPPYPSPSSGRASR